jgi:hypothetical protein
VNIGWLSPEGTNSFDSVSTLGTSINPRRYLLKRFLRDGHSVHWFGLKAGGHIFDSPEDEMNIRTYYDIKDQIQWYLKEGRKVWNEGKAKNPEDWSMTKWIISRAVRRTIRFMKKLKLPKLDVLFAEYMDNGMGQVTFFSAIVLYYCDMDTVIYVRDTENKFRYITEYRVLYPETRDNMYSHRLERNIPEEYIQKLRGRVRMSYGFRGEWDEGTEGFYKTPPLFLPFTYDDEREVDIDEAVRRKRTPVVYIGNDNNRQKMFREYYGAINYKSHIFGNWGVSAPDFVNDIILHNPNVVFKTPMQQKGMIERLSRAYSTVFVTKDIYMKCGQVTTRSAEVSQAAVIAVVPNTIPEAERFALDDFIVDGPDDMNDAIDHILGMKRSAYRDAIMDQRKLVKKHYGTGRTYRKMLKQFEEDGANVSA